MADYGYQYQHQLQMGSPCAEETLRKFLHMRWALSVMNRTPLSTDTDNCLCVDYATACDVIQGADTLCVSCGSVAMPHAASSAPLPHPMQQKSTVLRSTAAECVAPLEAAAAAAAADISLKHTLDIVCLLFVCLFVCFCFVFDVRDIVARFFSVFRCEHHTTDRTKEREKKHGWFYT
jgi:hypothetical protein